MKTAGKHTLGIIAIVVLVLVSGCIAPTANTSDAPETDALTVVGANNTPSTTSVQLVEPNVTDVSRAAVEAEAENASVRIRLTSESWTAYQIETKNVPDDGRIIVEEWNNLGEPWLVGTDQPSGEGEILVDAGYLNLYYERGGKRVQLGTYDPHDRVDAEEEIPAYEVWMLTNENSTEVVDVTDEDTLRYTLPVNKSNFTLPAYDTESQNLTVNEGKLIWKWAGYFASQDPPYNASTSLTTRVLHCGDVAKTWTIKEEWGEAYANDELSFKKLWHRIRSTTTDYETNCTQGGT